jgi:hypothetical protein
VMQEPPHPSAADVEELDAAIFGERGDRRNVYHVR